MSSARLRRTLDNGGEIAQAIPIRPSPLFAPPWNLTLDTDIDTVNIQTGFKILISCYLLSSQLLFAEEALDVPPPPPEVLEEEGKHLPEPEVTIIKRKGATIEEYRVNGQLRYAKITPASGPAYYMVDTDGDGQLDTRNDNLSNPPIQQWILWKW